MFSRGESQQRIEVFSVLVGPTFTRQQFIQANATDSFASIALSSSEQGVAQWQILDVDADWDDESGQVELRIEAQVVICTGSPQGQNVNIFGFNFAVTILASVPAT